MRLTPDDVICCPPPLFHCFGLIMGLLASIYYGSTIVFPSDRFHAPSVVDSILREDATILLGVPTMFVAELEVLAKHTQRPRRLRTGLASGSAVPHALMDQLRSQMGVDKMLIAYGMTETSPVTFITSLEDSEEKRMTTIGRPLPHTGAKVVDSNGLTVQRGQRGELCTSGFALQKGYWKNEAKTAEVMKRDEHAVLWMHTGDEVLIDDEGYGHITGRIKDVIIRGKASHSFSTFFTARSNCITGQEERISTPGKSKTDSCAIHPSQKPVWWESATSDMARLWVVSSSSTMAARDPGTAKCSSGWVSSWAGIKPLNTSFGLEIVWLGRTSPRQAVGSTRSISCVIWGIASWRELGLSCSLLNRPPAPATALPHSLVVQ